MYKIWSKTYDSLYTHLLKWDDANKEHIPNPQFHCMHNVCIHKEMNRFEDQKQTTVALPDVKVMSGSGHYSEATSLLAIT